MRCPIVRRARVRLRDGVQSVVYFPGMLRVQAHEPVARDGAVVDRLVESAPPQIHLDAPDLGRGAGTKQIPFYVQKSVYVQ